MKLQRLQIKNYRNLDGLDVTLNFGMNFLVGEGELGKSNFLDLLDIMFNRRSFSRNDFYNDLEPIEIQLSIRLEDGEIGIFEDYFDPSDKNMVHFGAKQDSPDETIAYLWVEQPGVNSRELNFLPLRRVNFIKYDSLRTPKDELGFDRERGVGRFLNFLVRNTLESNQYNSEILNSTALDPITKRINSLITKIRPLQKMGIGTFSDQAHQADLIARVLLLRGASEYDIQKSGCGVQFSTLMILSLLERLISMRASKRWKDNILITPLSSIPKEAFDNFLATNSVDIVAVQSKITVEDQLVSLDRSKIDDAYDLDKKLKRLFEKKSASIVVGLDEPEVHLHPYMQRSLIKYIQRILTNKDQDFNTLLRELLDLDEIDGQALVVSHSPSILLDDYKQITRFYKDEGKIKAISGIQLNFVPELEKHLLMNFPYIKEAFFSRCVVIVEGESEFGALMVWKDKYIEDADELGISIIGVGGDESIRPVISLLNELKIANIGIMDRDEDNDSKHAEVPNLSFTSLRDFEEEIYDGLFKQDTKVAFLFDLLKYVTNNKTPFIQMKKLQNIASKYKISQTWDTKKLQYWFSDPEISTLPDLQKAMFISWMNIKKSITFGRCVAIRIDWIPNVYLSLLTTAKSMAEKI